MSTVPQQEGTAHPQELSAAARALAARCVPRVSELARRMSRTALNDAPGYADLPADVKNGEVAASARHGLRLFVRRTQGQHGRRVGYGVFRERAARRAEEGIPLHLLLRAHALGAYVLWKALCETARPGEEAALVELSGMLLRAQESVVGAVAESYLDESAALAAERREHRQALIRGLLAGALPPDAGRPADYGLEYGGLVLCLRTDRTGTADGSGRAGRAPAGRSPRPALSPVVVRRRARRIQNALDRAFGTEVLTALDDDAGGHAIVPGPVPGGATPELPDGLAERLRQACGGEIRLAAVPADRPGAIADAARTASEVVRVAHASGRPPGVHRIEDVLLEFHLSRRDESSGLIAALLDPIGERPELVDTLRVYLENQQDRRGTARRLGLHPNTVDNRLTRIAELTGLDLASPRGTALALAALLLRDRPDTTG